MKNISEMTMEELERFIKYTKEQVKTLNELSGRRGDSKYQISIFNGCQNEIQIENRMNDIRHEIYKSIA